MSARNNQRRTADAVALDDFMSEGASYRGGKNYGFSKRIGSLVNFKILISIFVLFILIVSDVFTDNVISSFGGAVKCRSPTSYGIVVQGVFLVIFYVLAIHMIEGEII